MGGPGSAACRSPRGCPSNHSFPIHRLRSKCKHLARAAPTERKTILMRSLLPALWISWVSITVALTALVIFRSLVVMKEEDQLFVDPAEWQLEREQRAILTQLGRLTPVVKCLAVLSPVLLALIAAVW